MSGSERLDELNSAALAIINDTEGQVLDLERRVEELRSRVDVERRERAEAVEGGSHLHTVSISSQVLMRESLRGQRGILASVSS